MSPFEIWPFESPYCVSLPVPKLIVVGVMLGFAGLITMAENVQV